MALSASTVWEVRTTGSDTNGGGFVSGASGTDYSQQDSKNTGGSNISTTDAVANGTTTITSASASFTSAMVGNIVYFQGGTGSITAQWRQVTAFTNSTTITIDASIASSTGMTMNIGGALASPGQAGASFVANNKIYIKSGTYTITSATANVSSGCLSIPASTGGSEALVSGYQTTRGDYGTRPLLQASGISSFTMISVNTKARVENISVDGASLTSSKGIASASNVTNIAYNCKAVNCKSGGIVTSHAISCEATGCATTAAIGSPQSINCWAHDNTITGFFPSGTFTQLTSYSFCLSSNNTGASSDGFFIQSGIIAHVLNCTAYGSGRDGFRMNTTQAEAINCIAVNSSAFGFNNISSPSDGSYLFNCGGYNNTSGNTTGIPNNFNFVTLSGSPFTNAGSNDFSLNNTAGAGASCRAAGIPGVIAASSTTGYTDIGAAQHADPSASPFRFLGTLNISPQ